MAVCERDSTKCLLMCPHACVKTCPTSAFYEKAGAVFFDQEQCVGCGVCVLHCPGGALSLRDDQGSALEQGYSAGQQGHSAGQQGAPDCAGAQVSHRRLGSFRRRKGTKGAQG